MYKLKLLIISFIALALLFAAVPGISVLAAGGAIVPGDVPFIAVTLQHPPETVDAATEAGTYLVEFPDEIFRREVLRLLNVDGGNRTGSSIVSGNDLIKIASITSLNVYSMGISDMTGLKYFSGLKQLSCSLNLLTELDVSQNTALIELSCGSNQLTALDVSNNTALEALYCNNNQLSELDVSNNTLLWSLACGSNQLITLEVANNTALVWLYCEFNQLSSLDVSHNTALWALNCTNNQLTTLDMSENTVLGALYCAYNQLTELDLSQNKELLELDCGGNQLTALDVSKHTGLAYLYCYGNRLSALDLSSNIMLASLQCAANQLIALDVSKNTALVNLFCGWNQLSALGVANNSALRNLYCEGNNLTSLDVSHNTALSQLDCRSNYMESPLDVQGWQALELSLYNTFHFYQQKDIPEPHTFTGATLYQTSPTPATVALYDRAGNLLNCTATATNGPYTLRVIGASADMRYMLKVTKPGYLSYTVNNLALADGAIIDTIDIRQLAGDVNGDGIVNAVDLTYLLSEFNRAPVMHWDADIDGNGIVNAADLTYLLAGFNKRDVVVERPEAR